MKLTVINSGSIGNCYLLEGKNGTLILECGVDIREVKKALKFDFSKVKGALMSHVHGDHSKCVRDLIKLGVDIYSSQPSFDDMEIDSVYANGVQSGKKFTVGEFTIIPFDVEHDAPEPFGFFIKHHEMGNMVFLTDTYYCKYTFENVNHMLVEANYCEDIIEAKMQGNKTFLKNRIFTSHFSIQNCKKFIKAHDLKSVENIILIHLSDSNSDEEKFKNDIIKLTGKNTLIASKGLTLEL